MANSHHYIRSPLNYIGGKYRILSQILPLFPKSNNCFVDLFAGGGNVGLNAKADKIILNDNLIYLIEMYKTFKSVPLEDILAHINNRIKSFALSLTNDDGYKQMRSLYNTHKNPLDLFVLTAYSFNHQIRFNSNHEFNNPFGKERSCFNDTMLQNLKRFVGRLQSVNIIFSTKNFHQFDFAQLKKNDFVYCDPPYLISTGSYNDGKRGFTGWTVQEEKSLLTILTQLDQSGIKFALSNVLVHKGKTNTVLEQWIKDNLHFTVHLIKMNYANANYQAKSRDKSATQEILITNYHPKPSAMTLPLFSAIESE